METIATPAFRSGVAAMLLVGVGLGVQAGTARAQTSGAELLELAMERRENRMDGIENYTVTQTVNGTVSTLYFERVSDATGAPRFRVVPPGELMRRAREEGRTPGTGDEDVAGAARGGLQQALMEEAADAAASRFLESGGGDAAAEAVDPYGMADAMASRARLRGTEMAGDREAYVIAVDDMSGVDLGAMTATEDGRSFRPRSAEIWLDMERLVPLRSTMTGMLEADGRSRELTFDVRMRDYREVDGMLHPFRTELVTEGFGVALSDDQARQLERAREQMENQLEGMSAEQRAMVEKMMKERLPAMDAVGGEGEMKIVMEVRDLQVNAGPPENMGMAGMRGPAGRDAGDQAAGAERRRQEPEPAAQPSPGGPGEYEPRFARYRGVYESTGRPNRSFWVNETCGNHLAIGAAWGDVPPWIFDRDGEGEFLAPPISPGGQGMRIRFESAPDGTQAIAILSDGWEEYGRLIRSGDLAEGATDCLYPEWEGRR